MAGRAFPHCAVWGVLNITPDSFSDGGEYPTVAEAFARALKMRDEGASVIDVGGESSRPLGTTYGQGAVPVCVDEELARVMPVVEQLVDAGVLVSVDTVKAEVARRALKAGARIINDVSCGRDPALVQAVAEHDAELVLMHTRGRGEVSAENASYVELVDDVLREWDVAARKAENVGVPRSKLWLDPGLGFAKTAAQSAQLLAATARLCSHDVRVLVGASRKSFLGVMRSDTQGAAPPPTARLGASVAAAVFAARAGASAVRVHDVYETAQALAISAELYAREVAA